MKAFLTRIIEFLARFHIVFLFFSFAMIPASQFIANKLGKEIISYLSIFSSFLTTVCLLFQFLDMIPLSFIRINGVNNKYKHPLGATSNDIKREKIKQFKKMALYAAAILFPIMVVSNLIGIIMVLTI